MAGTPAWLSIRDAVDEILKRQRSGAAPQTAPVQAPAPAQPGDDPGVHYGALYAPPPEDLSELRRQQAAFAQTTQDLDRQNSWMAIPALAPAAGALGLESTAALASRLAPAAAAAEPLLLTKRDPYPKVGDFWATRAGRRADKFYKDMARAKEGWTPGPRVAGPNDTTLIPDIGAPMRTPGSEARRYIEVKPNTPSGRTAAARQGPEIQRRYRPERAGALLRSEKVQMMGLSYAKALNDLLAPLGFERSGDDWTRVRGDMWECVNRQTSWMGVRINFLMKDLETEKLFLAIFPCKGAFPLPPITRTIGQLIDGYDRWWTSGQPTGPDEMAEAVLRYGLPWFDKVRTPEEQAEHWYGRKTILSARGYHGRSYVGLALTLYRMGEIEEACEALRKPVPKTAIRSSVEMVEKTRAWLGCDELKPRRPTW